MSFFFIIANTEVTLFVILFFFVCMSFSILHIIIYTSDFTLLTSI